MSNIFDYIDWRGDIPFAVDPFNDVDNLIMAMLSYVDFEGVVPGPGVDVKVPITDVAERYFSLHTDEEIMARETFTKLTPFLLRKMAASVRYSKTELSGYVNIISQDENEQMSAVAIYLEDGSTYASFRGTDHTIIGWKEDFMLSYTSRTPGQIHAAAWMDQNFRFSDRPVLVGGHSKGGNFAVYASAFCTQETRDKIKVIYSNDGPGFTADVLETSEYKEILPRVVSILPEESFFGLLMYSDYENRVIKSSEKGVYQHDGMSWQVLGRDFVAAEKLSENSLFMDKTVTKWVEGFTPEERKTFVDAVFGLVDSAGAETIGDLNRSRVKTYTDIIKSFAALPKDQQGMIRSTLNALVRSGADVLMDQIMGEREERKSLTDSLSDVKDEIKSELPKVTAGAIAGVSKAASGVKTEVPKLADSVKTEMPKLAESLMDLAVKAAGKAAEKAAEKLIRTSTEEGAADDYDEFFTAPDQPALPIKEEDTEEKK